MINPYLWTIKITFADGMKMDEQVPFYHNVAERFQTWKEDDRDEADRPLIRVFPPFTLYGAKQ